MTVEKIAGGAAEALRPSGAGRDTGTGAVRRALLVLIVVVLAAGFTVLAGRHAAAATHPPAAPTLSCNLIIPGTCIASAAGGAAEKIAGGAADAMLHPLADSMTNAVTGMVRELFTWWLDPSSVSLAGSGVAGSGTVPGGVLGAVTGLGAGIAVLLLIYQAIRAMVLHRGAPLWEALRGLLICGLVTGAGLILLGALLDFGDAATTAILNAAGGPQHLEDNATSMLKLAVDVIGALLVVLFGIVIFIVTVLQLVMMFFRQAAIPVLAALLPIAAAGQVGPAVSRSWLHRLLASIIAIVLYKPLAALIFAIGFSEVSNGHGVVDLIRGLVTLTLAVIALPALMRIFTPIVGQAVGDGWQAGFGILTSTASDMASAMRDGKGMLPVANRGNESDSGMSPSAYERYSPSSDDGPPSPGPSPASPDGGSGNGPGDGQGGAPASNQPGAQDLSGHGGQGGQGSGQGGGAGSYSPSADVSPVIPAPVGSGTSAWPQSSPPGQGGDPPVTGQTPPGAAAGGEEAGGAAAAAAI